MSTIYDSVEKCIINHKDSFKIEKYCKIMQMARDKDISAEFKSLLISYYSLRKSRHWLDKYFETMTKCIDDKDLLHFPSLLEDLKDVSIFYGI